MKWLRENPFVAGLIVITVVGVGALGYFLSQFIGEYNTASEEYTAGVQTLQGLQNRVPFPNNDNLQKTKALEEQYRAALNTFWQSLAKMNVPIDPSVQPQQFQDDLRKAVNEVKAKAQENDVALPQGFYLGFNQFENSPPDAASAPALARQLQIVNQFVNRLIDLKVQSIDDLKLNEDRPSGTSSPAPANRPNNPSGLQKFPFSIAFTADQGKFRVAFNSLLGADEFLIIRSLSLQNTNPVGPPVARDGGSSSPAPASPEAPGTAPATGNLNVILGREFVKVALHLELVDFPAPPAPKQ